MRFKDIYTSLWLISTLLFCVHAQIAEPVAFIYTKLFRENIFPKQYDAQVLSYSFIAMSIV